MKQQTRDSCIECVEKHLGGAWVLVTEDNEGYDTRLRVVGELYQAEDESQAYPELHDAIREARKAYQESRTVPDFKSLSRLLKEARDHVREEAKVHSSRGDSPCAYADFAGTCCGGKTRWSCNHPTASVQQEEPDNGWARSHCMEQCDYRVMPEDG